VKPATVYTISSFTYEYYAKSYCLFIILQQNIDLIKVENEADVQSEDSIDIQTDEVCTPTAFTIKMAEPKVSLVFG
jgi:hypothetical protein